MDILVGFFFLTLGLFCGVGKIFMIMTSPLKRRFNRSSFFPQIRQTYLDISKGKQTWVICCPAGQEKEGRHRTRECYPVWYEKCHEQFRGAWMGISRSSKKCGRRRMCQEGHPEEMTSGEL